MNEPRRVLPYGPDAVLVEVADVRAATELVLALDDRAPAGVLEVSPGARTVLVRFDPRMVDRTRIARDLLALRVAATEHPPGPVVALPVRYDGEDLPAVAGHTGLSPDEIIARHLAGQYTVAFCGFAPGFAYLSGLDPVLQVPRWGSPRTAVPAGSVAIADTWTAVYPRSSPGGWLLIGHTPANLWNEQAEPPALLGPGTRVRFIRSSS